MSNCPSRKSHNATNAIQCSKDRGHKAPHALIVNGITLKTWKRGDA